MSVTIANDALLGALRFCRRRLGAIAHELDEGYLDGETGGAVKDELHTLDELLDEAEALRRVELQRTEAP